MLLISINSIGQITQSGGNIGISKNIPQYKLDVNGNINSTGYRINGTLKELSQWSTVTYGVTYASNVGIGVAAENNIRLKLYSTTPILKFEEDVTNKYQTLTLNSSGDLLLGNGTITDAIYVKQTNGNLGVLTTPSYPLDVDGIVRTNSYLMQQGIFAGIYVDDGSTAQSITNGTTYTKSTAFTTNGNASNCTADATNDKITITKTGKYMVMGTCSFTSGTNSVVWKCAAFLGGVEQGNVHWARKVGTGSDVGSASFMGTINVTSVPVDLDMRFRHDQAGAINITVVYSNITVNYLGE